MAGGNFDLNVGKRRPGTYINVRSSRMQKTVNATRGIAVVPLIGYDWGPDGEFLKLSAEFPDACFTKLGRSVYDVNDHMLLIREIFKKAVTCYVYIINAGTAAKAVVDGLTVTAAYGGGRGNDITIYSTANPSGGFDIKVCLGSEVVESYEGVETVKGLIGASTEDYVRFSGADEDAPLTAFASAVLTGGTTGSVENWAVTRFLDRMEGIRFHTMCFPTDEPTLQAACIAKVKNLREKVGKYIQAVMPSSAANTEGVINVTNSAVVDGHSLTVAQACAWVTGITCAATKTESNTYVTYDGATAVVGEKTNEEAEAAIAAGEFFFSMSEEGEVVVECDINSLHTFTADKTADYAKNRIIRVYDSFAEDLKTIFPPNKYDNTADGWLIMEGMGKALLQQYQNDGAIMNVDLDADFTVDRGRSGGDSTYFNVGIQAVDSAEKLYFSVATR